MRPLPHKGLRGGLFGLPTLRPTTLRDLAGLERVWKGPRKLWKKWQGEGKGGRSELREERVTKGRNRVLFIGKF